MGVNMASTVHPGHAAPGDTAEASKAVTEGTARLSLSAEREQWLATLPAEILARVLSELTVQGGHRSAVAAGLTCHALSRAAAWCWHEYARTMLGPEQPWAGQPATLRSLQDAAALTHVEWREAPDLNMPMPVFAHSSVVWRGTLYAFGGRHADTYMSRLHALALPPQQPAWRELTTGGVTPEPRRAHTACVHEGQMYVLGGGRASAGSAYGDFHVLDLVSLRWREEASPPSWQAFGHSCVVVSSSLARSIARRPSQEETGHAPHTSRGRSAAEDATDHMAAGSPRRRSDSSQATPTVTDVTYVRNGCIGCNVCT